MVKKCEINFTNSQYGVFTSGQTLEGSVELVLEKPKKVRSFKLEIHGFGRVSWSETESTGVGKDRKTRRVTYTGDEDYIRTTTFLVNGVNDEEVEIPAGVHTYHFKCFLPVGTPTSFEGKYGCIRYTVKATLDRPWKFDQTSKVGFTVIRQVDLNYENPSIRIPSQMEVIERFCCWPCESGPLMLTAQIPMSGYAPGQTIHISGELNNKSDVPSYRAKIEKLSVVEAEFTTINAEGSTLFNQALVIPSVAPTNLTQSRVIHRTYELIVRAQVSGCHSNPSIHIPIFIGTVPLPQVADSPFPIGPMMENQLISFPTPAAPPLDHDLQENTRFLELPPPSYQDCVMAGLINIESTNENPISTSAYTPKYPVYNYGWNLN